MNVWFGLSAEERKLLCENAGARLGIAAASIEKDFWVCWALREMFALPDWGPQLTFKGGTSLSKAWKLIERFSEDIDVTIERGFLGFGGAAISRSRIERLKDVCSSRISAELLPALRNRLSKTIPAGESWTLQLAGPEVDPDLQTLLFVYPSVLPSQSSYISRRVKIELGARSDTDPAELPSIQPLLAEDAGEAIGPYTFAVRTLAARRTFWEKAMLLHEEYHRPPGKPLKSGLSRHYYDLWCMIKRGTAAEAVADSGLFERIARHRESFFRHNWMDYKTLKKGSLRIVAPDEKLGEWRHDYQAMRGEMFLSEPPDFSEVLDVVRRFEVDFNRT